MVLLLWTISGCGEKSIEEEVLELMEESLEHNQSMTDNRNTGISVSADGKEFKKSVEGSDLEESVGVNDKGELVYKGGFKKGKPEGKWTTFFSDGKPRWEGIKKDGLNHGPYKMWFPDGSRKMEGFFKAGKKDGMETSWHLNGSKWHQRFYEQGVPVGTWKTWDQSGLLLSEVNHPPLSDLNSSTSSEK